jgi:hypothetical protein
VVTALLFFPGVSTGQVRPDSTVVDPDSLQVVEPEDSLALAGDTINPQDTLPAVDLPPLIRPVPAGWRTGVWSWDRDEILGTRALTLAELVSEIPGTVALRGGDYGMPTSVSAFGAGGGRIRVFRDGIEMLPLEGSVVDLTRIGLAGLEGVYVVRAVGEMQIHLESVLAEGGRPYSLIEAGTGDLNSNVFRGTFSHPRTLGGVVALTMERVDTRGPRGQEPGVAQGAWLRYARAIPFGGTLLFDFASRSADRGEVFAPQTATRSDWSLRTRWEPLPGLVGDLAYTSATITTEEGDSLAFDPSPRKQWQAAFSYDHSWIRAEARVRKLDGEGLPGTTAHLGAAGALGRYGGVSGDLTWEDWDSGSVTRTRLQAWTEPLWGLSLFAETGSGGWGLPYIEDVLIPRNLVQDPPAYDTLPGALPGPRFGDQSGTRFGAEFQWRGFELSGAVLEMEADSLFPLGLPTDLDGVTQAGASRSGFEVAARIPLWPSGFSLNGWWQKWDQADDVLAVAEDSLAAPELLGAGHMPRRYVPRQTYQASLNFHDTFKPTGNLEIWFDLGVRGRDPMALPFASEDQEVLELLSGLEEDERPFVPSMAPFYQSWFVRLQFRIVTVRVFFMWENFTLRQQNQDFIGRVLPASRSLYGVRWTLWN